MLAIARTACPHTTEKGKKAADPRRAIPPPEWSYLFQASAINPCEALSGRKQAVTLSCFSLSWAVMQMWDWGCPDCLWISRLLNTMIRDDSLSLSHTLNGSVHFLTWVIAVIVVSHSWGADTTVDSATGELPQLCWVRLLVSLGLRPCPHPAEVFLSHQVRQQKGASLGHIWHFSTEVSLQECFAYHILIDSD